MKRLVFILAICFSTSFAVSNGHNLKKDIPVQKVELHAISTNAP